MFKKLRGIGSSCITGNMYADQIRRPVTPLLSILLSSLPAHSDARSHSCHHRAAMLRRSHGDAPHTSRGAYRRSEISPEYSLSPPAASAVADGTHGRLAAPGTFLAHSLCVVPRARCVACCRYGAIAATGKADHRCGSLALLRRAASAVRHSDHGASHCGAGTVFLLDAFASGISETMERACRSPLARDALYGVPGNPLCAAGLGCVAKSRCGLQKAAYSILCAGCTSCALYTY